MKKKKPKRHCWQGCPLPRKEDPATCACGARLYYEERRSKDLSYNTEDEIIEIAGRRYVNPKPRPACTR